VLVNGHPDPAPTARGAPGSYASCTPRFAKQLRVPGTRHRRLPGNAISPYSSLLPAPVGNQPGLPCVCQALPYLPTAASCTPRLAKQPGLPRCCRCHPGPFRRSSPVLTALQSMNGYGWTWPSSTTQMALFGWSAVGMQPFVCDGRNGALMLYHGVPQTPTSPSLRAVPSDSRWLTGFPRCWLGTPILQTCCDEWLR
jgi:hypothetical protein